jgi:hypothetical protein
MKIRNPLTISLTPDALTLPLPRIWSTRAQEHKLPIRIERRPVAQTNTISEPSNAKPSEQYTRR